jgi:glutamine cyclotransferase
MSVHYPLFIPAAGRPGARPGAVAPTGGRGSPGGAVSHGRTTWAWRLLAAALVALSPPSRAAGEEGLALAPRCEYRVVETHPHRRDAFTQGLTFSAGRLYEGTGLYGRSALAVLDLPSGRVLREVRLPRGLFGEGVTILGDRVFQLTWREGRALVFDRETLTPLGQIPYAGEGWGLTHDGSVLIRSDGSATLRFLDPDTFAERRQVVARAGAHEVHGLNELEWVAGEVLANVWQTDHVLRIDPADGRVLGRLDLAELRRREGQAGGEAVANGIAYDPEARVLLVTGKLWDRLYRVRPTGGACGPLLDAVH